MRKQTKLVAVLSAAALLALGASMTSFAAGWEKDEEGIWHYYDSDDEMVTDEWKKDAGKWFYLDEDGDMLTNDWVDDDYYVGEDGAMIVNGWVKAMDDEDDDDLETVLGCTEEDDCDDEGWYWFGSSGKVCHQVAKKKINGRYYMFNEHGQMLYEWIDKDTQITLSSNAQLDDSTWNASATELGRKPKVENLIYYNEVEDGSRANGWYQIDGAKDLDNDGDTDWYYFDDGDVQYADGGEKDFATYDDDGKVFVQRIKIDGKYFAFNDQGQMQDGLQYVRADHGFYYFDSDGYQKTGRVSNVECDDDDYRLWLYNGDIYLTNNKGKIQKAKTGKKFDIENAGIEQDDVLVKTDSNGKVEYITLNEGKGDTLTASDLIKELKEDLTVEGKLNYIQVTEDTIVSVPFIQLYDDDVYTYNSMEFKTAIKKAADGTEETVYSVTSGEGWLGVNDKTSEYYNAN